MQDLYVRYIYDTRYEVESETSTQLVDRLIRYQIYKPVRVKVGVAVLKPTSDGYVKLGWSLCSDEDTFDKSVGIKIALDRAGENRIRELDKIKGRDMRIKVIRAISELVADYEIDAYDSDSKAWKARRKLYKHSDCPKPERIMEKFPSYDGSVNSVTEGYTCPTGKTDSAECCTRHCKME